MAADPLSSSRARTLRTVAGAFLRLGCISFGGPVAHLAHLRAELVVRRRWVDDAEYADLVALCQFLPGPASSQVVFALGMRRAGLAGALLASVCFTLPAAALMIALAFGVARAGDLARAGWLHGLKLAAVAVVAQAVRDMAAKLCPDRARIALCVAAAAALLAWPHARTQLAVLAVGALAGWGLYRDGVAVPEAGEADPPRRAHLAAVLALLTFATLLVALPVLARVTRARDLALVDSFYRAGSLVFGGGHVVLPLLRAEVVPRGWLSEDQFLAGYGAAQAMPGPLFAFSAYLGASLRPTSALRGCLGAVAIFLPAWLLVGGAMPFWQRIRRRRAAQAALAGANAAVVGVLLAALYTPVFTEAVRGPRDMLVALLAFALLAGWRAPPWLVVAGCAAAGQVMGGATPR
ncbi:MAG: chromate efflux transporter [Polyangiales bacterium]